MTLATDLGYTFQPKATGDRGGIARSLVRARIALRETHQGIDAGCVEALLSDLMHLCHTRGVCFESVCEMARADYFEERHAKAK